MRSTRDNILQATAELLERQGYFATGLNQIVEESGAPKGSLYYYFPDGKEGLIAEVIIRTGREIAGRIRVHLAEIEDPADAVQSFILAMARYIQDSSCRGGAPIATVALEMAATSDRLSVACQEAYDLWQGAFAEKLLTSGFAPERAQRLATCIISAIEGAIILSRTKRSAAPLEQIAYELGALLKATPRH
ncbi:MAG: putative HTH-type transcriptional regulator YxaF [Herpetosiphonaceae bacterium]|nr:MAG: putative HTH-type transcriptional regulator YxaF [Herpetosiphonaceae bacterium]